MIKRIRTMLLAFLYVVCVFPHPHAKAEYDELMIGDHVYLGTLEQDGKTENGKEPLSWTVIDLDESNCLLITDYIIDQQRFNAKKDSGMNWSNSDIRKWMNEELFNEIFTKSEQDIILPVKTDESSRSGNLYESTDRIFLLSDKEADQYLLHNEVKVIPAIMQGYTKEKEAYHREDWWLRSSHSGVRASTAHSSTYKETIAIYGVRPAIVVPKSEITVRPFQIPERDEYQYLIMRQVHNTAPYECTRKLFDCTEKYFSEHYDIAGRKKIKRSSSYVYALINLKTHTVLSFDDKANNFTPDSYEISGGGSSDYFEKYNFEIIEMSQAVKGFFK